MKMPAFVIWFDECSFHELGGKAVKLTKVEPNVKGYFPYGEMKVDSLEKAEEACYKINEAEGHSRLEVEAAVASSMFPTSYANFLKVHAKIDKEKAQAVAAFN
jgi:hypothetical protein